MALSPQLKQVLTDYMRTKAVGTDYVQILDGEARPVPISLRFQALSGFSVTDTAQLLQQAVTNSIIALRPGETLIYSDLVRTLDSVYGVDKLNMATPIADLRPSSTIELFTRRKLITFTNWSATEPGRRRSRRREASDFTRLSCRSFRYGSGRCACSWALNELTVVSGLHPGDAMLLGQNLSVEHDSTVNLLTGKASLWLVGAPGDLSMKLIPISGYLSERAVNVYVGYDGDNTQTKRREIRSALRAWSDGHDGRRHNVWEPGSWRDL